MASDSQRERDADCREGGHRGGDGASRTQTGNKNVRLSSRGAESGPDLAKTGLAVLGLNQGRPHARRAL